MKNVTFDSFLLSLLCHTPGKTHTVITAVVLLYAPREGEGGEGGKRSSGRPSEKRADRKDKKDQGVREACENAQGRTGKVEAKDRVAEEEAKIGRRELVFSESTKVRFGNVSNDAIQG